MKIHRIEEVVARREAEFERQILRLETEAARLKVDASNHAAAAATARQERDRAEAQVARLREALKPFLAAEWSYRPHAEPETEADVEDGPVGQVKGLLISHIRHARAALKPAEGEGA